MRIGAHLSVAGGVSTAVDRAAIHGCEALQIFAKNANQWRGTPLDASEIRRFRQRIDQTGIRPAVSHASYLINRQRCALVHRHRADMLPGSGNIMTDQIDSTPPQELLLSPTCPLCHTRDLGMTSHALNEGASWRCTRCGQRWTAERLATAAASSGA